MPTLKFELAHNPIDSRIHIEDEAGVQHELKSVTQLSIQAGTEGPPEVSLLMSPMDHPTTGSVYVDSLMADAVLASERRRSMSFLSDEDADRLIAWWDGSRSPPILIPPLDIMEKICEALRKRQEIPF